jgi:hypothetical protein
VSSPTIKTTVPESADTVDPGSQAPSWALVLLNSHPAIFEQYAVRAAAVAK